MCTKSNQSITIFKRTWRIILYVVLIWVLVQHKWCNIHSIKHSQYGIEWCSLCIDFFICISYNVCKYLSSSKFIIYLLIERMAHFFPNISLLLEYTLFHVKYQWKLAKWIIHLKCRYEWIPKYLIGYEWNMYKSVLWGDSAYTSNNGPNQKLCATIRNI